MSGDIEIDIEIGVNMLYCAWTAVTGIVENLHLGLCRQYSTMWSVNHSHLLRHLTVTAGCHYLRKEPCGCRVCIANAVEHYVVQTTVTTEHQMEKMQFISRSCWQFLKSAGIRSCCGHLHRLKRPLPCPHSVLVPSWCGYRLCMTPKVLFI